MITQLGVGGILAVLIIREVLGYLAKRDASRGDPEKNNTAFTHKDRHMIRDLHTWHAKEDDDGVKVWYGRKTLELAVGRLADNLEQQTIVLRELHTTSHDTLRVVSRCEEKLNS